MLVLLILSLLVHLSAANHAGLVELDIGSAVENFILDDFVCHFESTGTLIVKTMPMVIL